MVRAHAARELGLDYWLRRIEARPKPPDWDGISKQTEPVRIIAEFKPSSPSSGVLADPLVFENQIRTYQQGGAVALSILTEPLFFHGHMDFLLRASKMTTLPLLRKDFILDPIQMYEASACGASAVLVIHRLVDEKMRRILVKTAHQLGLAVLYEVFTADEAREALDLGVRWIGINNRDLMTLKVDPFQALRVYEALDWPDPVRVVVESGVQSEKELKPYLQAGLQYFLIGTALMKSSNPVRLLQRFRTTAV